MKKQLKILNLHTERVMSFSAMKGVKGGTAKPFIMGTGPGGGPQLMTSIGPACPTLVQGNTITC
ncbi:MAG: hypothetical protein U0Y10_08400 [Spirosomataceae bacterium]